MTLGLLHPFLGSVAIPRHEGSGKQGPGLVFPEEKIGGETWKEWGENRGKWKKWEKRGRMGENMEKKGGECGKMEKNWKKEGKEGKIGKKCG